MFDVLPPPLRTALLSLRSPATLRPLLQPCARPLQEALHLQVATLYLMQRHGLSRQQVGALCRDHPTLMRTLKLE